MRAVPFFEGPALSCSGRNFSGGRRERGLFGRFFARKRWPEEPPQKTQTLSREFFAAMRGPCVATSAGYPPLATMGRSCAAGPLSLPLPLASPATPMALALAAGGGCTGRSGFVIVANGGYPAEVATHGPRIDAKSSLERRLLRPTLPRKKSAKEPPHAPASRKISARAAQRRPLDKPHRAHRQNSARA